MDALREGRERQLLALKALRDSSVSDEPVCVNTDCFQPKKDHGRSNHMPTYWPIDQAITKLEHLLNPPTHQQVM